MEGKKNDRKDDKTRWELIPLDCLEDIARVYTEGAKKYEIGRASCRERV